MSFVSGIHEKHMTIKLLTWLQKCYSKYFLNFKQIHRWIVTYNCYGIDQNNQSEVSNIRPPLLTHIWQWAESILKYTPGQVSSLSSTGALPIVALSSLVKVRSSAVGILCLKCSMSCKSVDCNLWGRWWNTGTLKFDAGMIQSCSIVFKAWGSRTKKTKNSK